MDLKAAARLRYIGVFVVGVALLLMWLPIMAKVKVNYDDAIASTLAIGIGLLLLSEIGPIIKSLKAGGVEIELLDSVGDKFNGLETRVAALELAAKNPGRSTAKATALREASKPKALDLPITVRDDPHKGRFGGEAARDGFTLSAAFRHVTSSFVEVVLTVKAPEGAVPRADSAMFYLHDTFDPWEVPAVFQGNVAELSLLARGGFTVGVWIASSGVELELDLSKVRGAPRIIRDL